MVLEAAKCPNCGANIELDPKKTFFVCGYCGANVSVKNAITAYQEEQKKEYRLKIADECLEKGITEDAEDIYKEISKEFPNDYRGWWGIIKCAPIYSYLHGEMKNEYKRALAFAPENIKPEILENQKLRNLYVSKGDKLKRIKQIEKGINRIIESIEENRDKINCDLKEIKNDTKVIIGNYVFKSICFIIAVASIIGLFTSLWLFSIIGCLFSAAMIYGNDNIRPSIATSDKKYALERVSTYENYIARYKRDLEALKKEKQELELQINEINKALNL